MKKNIAIILFLLFSFVVHAQEYKWHDGKQEHKIYLNNNVVAEFADKKIKAKPVIVSKQIQLKRMKAATIKADYAPVFSDLPNGEGRLRALTGELIITFRPELTDEDISLWAKQNGLVVERKFLGGQNIYLLKGKKGLENLIQANALRSRPEVVSSRPNWWIDVKKKGLVKKVLPQKKTFQEQKPRKKENFFKRLFNKIFK